MRRTAPVRMAALALLMALMAALTTAPLAAYTVFFRDGRTLQTKDKPRVVNGRAVVTLLNGTQASFDPKDIDQRRTDEMNKKNLGAAEIIATDTPAPQEPAPSQSASRITDIASRGVGTREPVRREASASAKGATAVRDLMTAQRNPYPDAAMASELRTFFLGQKVEGVEVYQGTQTGRPLIEITTSSESAVFRALQVGASAVLHVRDRFPQKTASLELLMLTPGRERAGQFVLTQDMAESLVSKRVSLVSFFLDNVQF